MGGHCSSPRSRPRTTAGRPRRTTEAASASDARPRSDLYLYYQPGTRPSRHGLLRIRDGHHSDPSALAWKGSFRGETRSRCRSTTTRRPGRQSNWPRAQSADGGDEDLRRAPALAGRGRNRRREEAGAPSSSTAYATDRPPAKRGCALTSARPKTFCGYLTKQSRGKTLFAAASTSNVFSCCAADVPRRGRSLCPTRTVRTCTIPTSWASRCRCGRRARRRVCVSGRGTAKAQGGGRRRATCGGGGGLEQL